MDNKTQPNGPYRTGVAIFIILVSLTIGEYAIGAIAPVWGVALLGVAILKAYYIIRDYMHLPRLFSGEEDHS
jgi:hypothetical protein